MMNDDGADTAAGSQRAAPRVDFAGINALASRPAGYAVALKCLQVQAEAEELDPSLRSERHLKLHEDAWPWYQGARGEIEVGTLLAELGPDWFVRHSVPIGADTKDVDHLVIGPGGVFAINTKHHAGASVWVGDYVLRVNNGNTPHLKVARNDAGDVSRRLAGHAGFPVPVTPVIAVLNARSIKDSRAPQNRTVAVTDARHLVAWLRAQPPQLSSTKIELLKLAAEEPATWHVDPRAADTLRVMQRFERLVARVDIPDRRPPRPSSSTTSRRPTTWRPSRTVAGRSATSRPSQRADVIRAWFGAAIVVAAILIIRSIADQPCGSPLACVFPSIYVAWRPLMVFGGFVAVAVALLRTAQYGIPSITAAVRRRRDTRAPRPQRHRTASRSGGQYKRHPMNPPAGWYADPTASGDLRYWNGATWTEHTSPHNPVPSPASPPASATAQPVWSGSAPYAAAAAPASSYRDPAPYPPLQSGSPYAGPHYVVSVPPKNGKATRALVWGIISLFINPFALPSILAIVFGAQARTTADQMEQAGLVDSGRGRATSGLVLGCVGAAFFVVWMVVYFSGQLK